MKATLDLEPLPLDDLAVWAEPAASPTGRRAPVLIALAAAALVGVTAAAVVSGEASHGRRTPQAASSPAVPAPPVRPSEVVLAEQPLVSTYAPRFGLNYEGGKHQPIDAAIERTGVGRYTVTFHGVGVPSGDAAAASLAADSLCVATRWGAVGPDEVIDVWCDIGRVPSDGEFTIWFAPK